MLHNAKKRTISEGEAVKKVKEEFVSKKKKLANGTPQNGQAKKEVKKEVLPQVKVEQKPGGDKKTIESRKAYREKRKQARAAKGAKPDISVEDIKKKVEEIEKRGDLSKSAKRKLAALKKLLHVKEGTYKPKPQVAKKQADEGKKKKQAGEGKKEKQVGEGKKEKQAGEGKKEKQAGEVKKEKQAGGVKKEKQAGEVKKEKQAGEVKKEKQAGEVKKEKQAGEGKKEKQIATANKKQVQNTAEQKKKVPEKVEAKPSKDTTKKDVKQGNLLLVKQKNQPQDVESESTGSSSSSSSSSSYSSTEYDTDDTSSDSSCEDEESSEEGFSSSSSSSEDSDVVHEGPAEESAEKEDAEEVKTKDTLNEPKQAAEQGGKKKRYVLFVGNLPFNVTAEEIKKHFLTKVSQIVDIRIPKSKDNAPRGFAYVELGNHTDYEKAISLNNSFVNGRRINVQYSGSNKKETVAKNQKLQALHKAGKLGGGQKTNFRKNAGGKGGKPNAQKTKT